MKKDFMASMVSDLKPFQSIETIKKLSIRYAIVVTMVLTLSVLILPVRSDFDSRILEWFFILENILWISLTGLSFQALYESALPDTKKLKTTHLYSIVLALIGLSFFHHQSPGINHELELIRGGCGLIIMILSVLSGTYLFYWARKAAPASPAKTGVLAALSSASLGCLIMQFACAWDTSTHLILWHFIPLIMLTLAGQFLARKLLHW